MPTENNTKEFQASFLLDATSMFASLLKEMKWLLVSNKTNLPYWTSDSPITRYNPHKSDIISNLGLKSSGIQLHIPISPWLVIIICDPLEYANMNSDILADPPNIGFKNSMQVITSKQYLFSVHDDFDLAKEMINGKPELANLDRTRVSVL